MSILDNDLEIIKDNKNEEQTDNKSPKKENESQVTSKKWRVKLYKLDDEGEWDDICTGKIYLKIENNSENINKNTTRLILISEEDEEKEINFLIPDDTVFHFQKGTILTWKSEPYSIEDNIAISFKDKEGIYDICNYISSIENKYISEDEEEDEDFSFDITDNQLESILGAIINVYKSLYF